MKAMKAMTVSVRKAPRRLAPTGSNVARSNAMQTNPPTRNGIMTLSSSIRRKVGLVIPLVTMLFLFGPGQAFGLTAAGQAITNEATVSYEDSLGNPFSATSNEAVVTVAEVHAATLEQDRTRTGAPGQTVYFQHFLENTGNATDTYTIETFRDDLRDGTSDDGTDDSDFFVYLDTNGNGEPNAGEPVVLDPADPDDTLALAAGDTANLLVAFPIPGGANGGDAFGATISVTSTNAAVVDDLSGSDGNDGLEGTNNDLVNVTTGPALTLVKNATFDDGGTPNDADDDGVVYTLQVTNNGGSAAENVDIIDVIPENTTFVEVTAVSGLSAGNSDRAMINAPTLPNPSLDPVPTDLTTIDAFALDETGVGRDGAGNAENLDLNQNGNTSDTSPTPDLTSIYFRDASLAPNVTVSITYRVDIDGDLAAGTTIPNVFIADNTDSPQVTVTVPQTFDVDAADTGTTDTGSPNVNDGNDDDDADNDEQFVDRVADGETVRFTNVITNEGNGADVIELSIANDAGATSCSAFPSGTSFSLYNAANNATLSNTNGQFGIDTGTIAAGDSLNITVRANLPDGFSGGASNDFCATLTARSFGAGTTSPVTDTKVERLGAIVAPTLDLANADYDTSSVTLPQEVSGSVTSPAAAGAGGADTDGFNDDGSTDTHPAGAITSFAQIAAGGVQDFELFIANEGGAPDSYDLTASDVPAGWTVQFIEQGVDTDGDGTPDSTAGAGSTVTSTPLIPAGGVYQYTARVTVSGNPAEALANAPSAGVNADANGDGDVDYGFTFTATSTTNGASSDSKVDAIDVADDAAVEVNPDSQDQVQPGGSVSYANTVTNTGNVTLDVTLTLSHSLAGFDDTTLIDTDGDGTGDTEYGNLTTGTITVDDGNGFDQDIEVSVANAGDPPVFTLEPGEVIPLDVTVQAPANAAQGDEDFFLIDATDSGVASDDATDRTEVVTVQVRLTKTVAVDTADPCTCDPGTVTFPPIAGSGATQASSDAEPGQCVIWKLEATNQSTQDALNVTINDQVTAFTTLVDPDGTAGNADDGQLYYQGPADTSLTLVPDSSDPNGDGLVSGTDIAFDVGTLAAGDSATGTFCVVVD